MRPLLWILAATVGCSAAASVRPQEPRPSAAADLVRSGDHLRRHGDVAGARDAYERAVAADDQDIRAHVGLQVLAEQEGRHLELRRAQRSKSQPFLAGRLERGERQRDAFRRADEPWRSLGLGSQAAAGGDLEDAAARFERALARDAGQTWSRLALGHAQLRRGRLGEAEQAFVAAAWTEPEHPGPHVGLSLIQDRRGNLREALAAALLGYRRAPADDDVARRIYGLALRSGSRRIMKDVGGLLETNAELGEGNAPLWAADLLTRGGHAERGRAMFRAARARGVTKAEVDTFRRRRHDPGIARFVRAFARGVRARYRHYSATREAEKFGDFVRWARDLYERARGKKLGPPGRLRDYSFVGRLVDPGLDTDEPLVAACAEQGLLLVLGQRRGGPPEAMLAEIVRREPRSPVRVRGTDVEREVVWVGRRYLPGYVEWAGGGDLAGLALDRFVIVDLHAIAKWEGDLRRRLRRLAPHREALLSEPALEDRPVTDVDDPAGVAERLFLGADIDLAAEILVHEDSHLVDAKRHLPVGRHALRNLGLALRRGFSVENILALLERNAQLTAIAEGPSPRASFAVCCSLLDARGAHAAGYAEIVQGFVDAIHADPGAYPAIDPERVIVQQLHRLTDDQIRVLAQGLIAEWDLNE